MINRRKFLLRDAPAAALGLAATLEPRRLLNAKGGKSMPGAIYALNYIRLELGVQVNRVSDWFEKRALPLFQKHGIGPAGFFTVDVGPWIPAVLSILAYPSLGEIEALRGKLDADPEWTAAMAELEKDGPGFYREDSKLLRATTFSPPLKPWGPGNPTHKIFELRIYESPTQRQLQYLHDRFAGGEIEIFHKCGIYPVLYADTILGPNRPNMTYLIPFESEAQREKAWAAFRDYPDWQKLRADSIRRGGEIVRNLSNMILVPTSFSPIR